MVMVLLFPATHVSGTVPLWHASIICSHVLSAKLAFRKLTSTVHVLLVGAVWFVPAATLTVIVALPFETPVTVTVFPLTLTVAVPGALLTALIAPSPALVTVMPALVVLLSRVIVVGLMDKLPLALPMVQVAFLAVVVPSDQQ